MPFPYYGFNSYPTQYQPPQNNGGITWVQGVEAMKSYPVQAGQSALLMDTETNCFGIKTVDASGMPLPLRLFDYKERTQNVPQPPVTPVTDTSVFITREEFESRLAAITAATERIESDAE